MAIAGEVCIGLAINNEIKISKKRSFLSYRKLYLKDEKKKKGCSFIKAT